MRRLETGLRATRRPLTLPDRALLCIIGTKVHKEGFLTYPSQLCINARGEIFIADTNDNRIPVFTLKGNSRDL
jgi:hypothetical protein